MTSLSALKRSPAFVGSFLGTTVMGVTYLIQSGLPKYFFGDDYLLLMASRSTDGYASSFLGCVNDIGMGKWRPMFVCTAVPVLRLFGENYLGYFLFNLFLIFLISLTACALLQRSNKISAWQIALCAFAVPFSRFAWYGRISPFGLMEFGALLFALLFARQYMVALERQTKSSWYFAGGLACLSALFHERYLVLLAAGLLVALFNVRNKRLQIPVSPWLVFSAFLLVVKMFLLRTDPLVGGGEAPLRSSFNTWVLEHFLVGLKAIAGIGNGTNISFDVSGYVRTPALGVLGKAWLLVLLLLMIYVAVTKASHCSNVRISEIDGTSESVQRQKVLYQLLITSGFFLLIPASTIISRIEGRWLLGPEVLLFLFVIVVIKSTKLRVIAIACFLLSSVTCLKFLPDYEQPITLSNQVLEYVDEKLDGRNQLVYTIVDPRDRPELINWLDWVLGRGDKFKQLGVKSVRFASNNECQGSCVRLVFTDSERFEFVRS